MPRRLVATEMLDIVASLSRALVSTETVLLHQSTVVSTEVVREHEEGLALWLHSRAFLSRSKDDTRVQSYRSLVLVRLRRDSACTVAMVPEPDGRTG
uniref:Uncharacterized protein n=1 Tax=Oryza rufipogon TaxID=4529 RepID=A0A0E0Q205_ORYRU